ncbi:alpha/beta fold hydrolase [Candidatus Leptofilum sp.]|uniref:alpha/beta fold hydrolase n=1 Tax=Candidatus Leptofilum sp. TaxID=3241576 RepID=UPI003B5CF785
MIFTSTVTVDGTNIVYDVAGEGPAIMLLHGGGGGQTRKSWHEAGYVSRLQNEFKLIAMDIRGHGESDKPTAKEAYTIDKMCKDVLAVADACEIETFALWGFSYGGNIGRYLAANSNRVEKIIVIGIPFGQAASGEFRQFINEFRAHWEPILQANKGGVPNLTMLSEEDREIWQVMDVPVTLAWLTAMLDWEINEPQDLLCPALWLSGSGNESTVASIKKYRETAVQSSVQIEIVPGLTHIQEFEEIDRVFPIMLEFVKS